MFSKPRRAEGGQGTRVGTTYSHKRIFEVYASLPSLLPACVVVSSIQPRAIMFKCAKTSSGI